MPLINTKDKLSKFLFFLTLCLSGFIINGYEQVYCMPTLEAKVIVLIAVVSTLLSTFVANTILQPFIYLGLGVGLSIYIYLLLFWGVTLLWGIIWIIPFLLLFLLLQLFGITTWVIVLAIGIHIKTGSLVLLGLVTIITPFILWKLEEKNELWLQRLTAIALGLALMAYTPVILAWDVVVLYLKGKKISKITFAIGVVAVGMWASWHYVQYQHVVERIEEYGSNEELSLIVEKEELIRNPYFEKLLGIHIKYHTRFCEYDGRRPPIHDPFLVLFLRIGSYPKVLTTLSFAERVAQYTAYYNTYSEECNCAYFRDEGLYWNSRSFQNARNSSLGAEPRRE